MSSYSLRGLHWFNALSAGAKPVDGLPASLKVADGVVGEQPVRFIQIRCDDFIHGFGQSPTFQQTDLAIAGADETVVGISHHRDKTNGLVTQDTVGNLQ